MYWGMGQMMLRAARFVKRHPQLFATYITNFSCGPDSFLLTYFRSIMGDKPSLTLELDSHTADAGIETRIEAFIDIVAKYRQINNSSTKRANTKKFFPASIFLENRVPKVTSSNGKILPITDPGVTFLLPSMGWISTQAIAAVFRRAGFNVAPHPPADEAVLKLGRANTSCKECLPLILTAGTMLNYVYNHQHAGEILVYFMPSASGPCRFGQYAIFMQDLIKRLRLPNVAVFSLTSDNTYTGMGNGFSNKKAWSAILVADIMEDLYALLLANSKYPEEAKQLFNEALQSILNVLIKGDFRDLETQISYQMKQFSKIKMKRSFKDVPKILLTGEIFVRRDGLSRQNITERLAEMGFAVICSPVSEWMRYTDYIFRNNGEWSDLSMFQKLKFNLRQIYMNRYEKRLTSLMSQSEIFSTQPVNLEAILKAASPFISQKLTGEAILTIGSSISEIASEVCGVIALGPFGCMPNRLSESILTEVMTTDIKLKNTSHKKNLEKILSDVDDLPFLAIESDGSPFPQLIDAKIEAFCQRASRLHEQLRC